MKNYKLAKMAYKWVIKEWEYDIINDISQINFNEYLLNGDIVETPDDTYRDYAWEDGTSLCKYGRDMWTPEEFCYQVKDIARNMIKDGDFIEVNGEVFKKITL